MWISEALKNTVLITSLVMIMMFLIEFININSHGKSLQALRSRPFLQILLSAVLGFIPGCAGGFIVVSLYAHNMVSFGALMAMLICTIGDDGFMMLAMVPQTAAIVSLCLLAAGILIGWLCDLFIKKVPRPFGPEHYPVHEHEIGKMWAGWKANFRRPSAQRIIILLGLLAFCACVFTGIVGHSHEHEISSIAEEAHHHAHEHSQEGLFSHGLVNYIFGLLGLVTALFVSFASEHFVKEHLWKHIIHHHFLKILCWTAGILLCIGFLMQYIDLQSWVEGNYVWMLIAALLVGLIPQSGPNMIFISLFATGNVPLSILMANSIVQDGHASLPLLAETKKGFVISKALKMVIAVLMCLIWEYFFRA